MTKNRRNFNDRKEEIFIKFANFSNKIFSKSGEESHSCLISFSSNNYLNLGEKSQIINAGIKALKKYGASASASKFIEGYNVFYEEIRHIMCKIKKMDDALVFNSGYSCNLGIFTSIASKNDIFFLDELCHASIFDGIKLCGAKFIRYKHNSFEDLEKKIKTFGVGKNIVIATETVFSMKGSVLKNPEMYIELSRKYGAILVTDEAHSFGVMDFDFPEYKLHLRMGTFSKAVGVFGGYVCGNAILIDIIRNFARSGIYTTALPPSILASICESLRLIQDGINGKKALKNALYFAKLIGISCESQIVFLECESSLVAIDYAKKLETSGFFVKAIRRPTVEQPGLRFSFTNRHKMVDIRKLSFIVNNLFGKNL